MQVHEQQYAAFAKAMGVDTATHQPIPFDITNKKFATNYFDILLHPYEKAGIDFWWLDWQQWGSTNIKGVNPTFYLNYVHYSDMQRQGKRPLIFHRYGGLGNHRYQIGFSGDYFINWNGLAYQPEFTATAGNVGFGFWSHDIGGHMGFNNKNKHNAELYTRWVQWGAFSPVFRTHATADKEIERRMWLYPEENLNAMCSVLQLRNALLPYIYTCSRLAYDSGVSLIRPMYYQFPEKEEAYHLPHQYYFGDNMIVAPVYKSMKGSKSIAQSVWLPEGKWFNFYTNRILTGGAEVVEQYSLNEIPVYIKTGSIIPMQTQKERISGSIMDTLILTVYPDSVATFNLYEDDGVSEAYKEAGYSFTKFEYRQTTGKVLFTITPDGRHYSGQPDKRCYIIRLVTDDKPVSVTYNNTVLPATSWNANSVPHMVVVTLPKQEIAKTTLQLTY